MKSVTSSVRLASISETSNLDIQQKGRSQTAVSIKMGLYAAVAANVLWGTSFLASKYTLVVWGPFTAASLRFAIASILMFFGLRLFGRDLTLPKTKKDWLYVATVATTGFGLLYPLQLAGLKLISSGLSAAIMLTSPLFVVVFSHFFLKDTLSKEKLIALGFGIIGGIFLLNANGTLNVDTTLISWGSILTIGASLSLALSVIATRQLTGRLDSASLTFWSMALGFVQLTIAAFFFEEEGLGRIFTNSTFESWAALLFLAVVCSAFCFFLWNFALTQASPKEIASTMHIKTPTAVLIGVFVAGEIITKELIVGTVIVMFGVWLSQQKPSGVRK